MATNPTTIYGRLLDEAVAPILESVMGRVADDANRLKSSLEQGFGTALQAAYSQGVRDGYVQAVAGGSE